MTMVIDVSHTEVKFATPAGGWADATVYMTPGYSEWVRMMPRHWKWFWKRYHPLRPHGNRRRKAVLRQCRGNDSVLMSNVLVAR